MIIRILGEGQYVVEKDELAELNELDEADEAAAVAGDQAKLTEALTALLDHIRAAGAEVADDILADSDLILPPDNATVEQIRALLDETSDYPGIIPG